MFWVRKFFHSAVTEMPRPCERDNHAVCGPQLPHPSPAWMLRLRGREANHARRHSLRTASTSTLSNDPIRNSPDVRRLIAGTTVRIHTPGPGMASEKTIEKPPILICPKCRKPMDFLATLPRVANLPAVYAYRCLLCVRVATIDLE